MRIGSVQLSSPLVLAPLAGYSDLAFRILCREHGAGLCFSEMVSTHGLCYNARKTQRLLATRRDDHPFFIQLFGADLKFYRESIDRLHDLPIDGIDINMGCPVRKVVKKGAGAALMQTPHLAEKIINTVTKRASLPVTVKFRSGWDADSINAVSFARMAEDAGASAVTVHARTWRQGFGGRADWSIIAAVKQAVRIPVFGNGDITSYDSGMRMVHETGCDGAMIGRGALGNPWVFSPAGKPTSAPGRATGLLRHLELIRETADPQDPNRFLGAIRGHASRYFSGLPNASQVRSAIFNCTSFEELTALVKTLL